MLNFIGDLRLGKKKNFRIVSDDEDGTFFVDITRKTTGLLYERRRFSTLSSARVYVSKNVNK